MGTRSLVPRAVDGCGARRGAGPGNAGTILRAAEAFGATGVLFLKGTVSPFNPKTLRASAGSLFRLPFASGLDAALARAALSQKKLDLYAAVPKSTQTTSDVDLTRRCGIINRQRRARRQRNATLGGDGPVYPHQRGGIPERGDGCQRAPL